MSLIQQIKRAALDKNAYLGSTNNDNWGTAEVHAWSYLCDRFGGYFTPEPRTLGQSPAFIEFLDKYKLEEYTDTRIETPTSGIDVRRLIPEVQPVNTEGLTRQEAALKREVINGNANVKVPDDMKPNEVLKPSAVQRKPVTRESINEPAESNKNNNKPADSQSTVLETRRIAEVSRPTGNTVGPTEGSVKEAISESLKIAQPIGNKPNPSSVSPVETKQPTVFNGTPRPVRVR